MPHFAALFIAYLAKWLLRYPRRVAITPEIISQDMSVPQNSVRLVNERWFGRAGLHELNKRSVTMRFMVIVKASKDTEAGVMPSTEMLTAMGKFNEEMVKAGVMEAGEGLHPTSKGARIKYSGKQPGPEPRSVRRDQRSRRRLLADQGQIAGRGDRLDEARAVRRRRRNRNPPVFSAEDFGEALTPELREQEERLRAQAGKK